MADDFKRVIGEGYTFKGASVPLGAALRAGDVFADLPVGAIRASGTLKGDRIAWEDHGG